MTIPTLVRRREQRSDDCRFWEGGQKRAPATSLSDWFTKDRDGEALKEMLSAIAGVDLAAKDDGYPVPGRALKESVERLVRRLFRAHPRAYEIYPTERGEIAVDVIGPVGKGLLLVCESSGVVTCYVTIAGENRRARYEDATRLPDAFLTEALAEIDEH